jgi:tetratricopeptide (TPR) repeat protein
LFFRVFLRVLRELLFNFIFFTVFSFVPYFLFIVGMEMGQAIAGFRETFKPAPDDAFAYVELGNEFTRQENWDRAVDCYLHAIEFLPGCAQIYSNLGNVYTIQQKLEDAIAVYRTALELMPDCAEVHNNLGNALAGQDRFDEAVACFQKALQLKPMFADAQINLGNTFMKVGKLDQAIESYFEALRVNPKFAEVYNNLGNAYCTQGDLDQAIACYRKALELKPDLDRAQVHLGVVFLTLGNFAEGWQRYELRLRIPPSQPIPTHQPLVPWDGSLLNGRRILLCCEQGLGDTLQFIRYAPLVKARGGYVIVACQPSLLPLLKHCPGIDEVVPQPKTVNDDLPQFDVYLYLMSAPHAFRTTLRTIPATVPYLHAEEHLVEQWRRELAGIRDLKIGIVWQGSRENKGDRFRSIELAHFQVLGDVQGVKFFSLQKGYGREQLRHVTNRMQVIDHTERMDEATGAFLDTAAVMKNLDMVITCDTSSAHLAGSLGVPVWVAISHAPDWRWLRDRDDSPWYPTMRLFRQESPGDWAGVIQRIAAELRELVNRKSPAVELMPPETMKVNSAGVILVETSLGELADKITIMRIKSAKIVDRQKLANIRNELGTLSVTFEAALNSNTEGASLRVTLDGLVAQLETVNETLWCVEDAIRDCERIQDFGEKFVELARAVYRHNDRRTALKRRINVLFGSRTVEEKSYQSYEVVDD